MNYILRYPGSALFYVSILLICLIFAYLAGRGKNKKRTSIWVWVIIIILSIVAGVRGSTVGIDVAHYIVRHIEPIREGMFARVRQPIGFRVLVWTVYQFTSQTYMVFIVFGFITNGLIVRRLWDFRHKASFVLMILFYYCSFYLITFNVLRQFLAIAVVFFATRLLERRQYIKYGIGIAIAMTLHVVAIMGFALIPIMILMIDSKDQKLRKGKKMFLLASPFVIMISAILLYRYFDFDHFIRLYHRFYEGRFGFMTPLKIIFSIFVFYVLSRDRNITQKLTIDIVELKWIFCVYFMGLIISMSIIVSSFADRFAWFYTPYEMIFASLLIGKKDFRIVIHGIYILLALYTLYMGLSTSGQGIMPYRAFWH